MKHRIYHYFTDISEDFQPRSRWNTLFQFEAHGIFGNPEYSCTSSFLGEIVLISMHTHNIKSEQKNFYICWKEAILLLPLTLMHAGISTPDSGHVTVIVNNIEVADSRVTLKTMKQQMMWATTTVTMRAALIPPITTHSLTDCISFAWYKLFAENNTPCLNT